MPYKRGFTNIFRTVYETVKVGNLDKWGIEGVISPDALLEKGKIETLKRPLKILGDGEISSPVHVRAHKFTASAKAKIEAAGGTAEVID
jgi:large subunit ribosomal protein L15